MATYNLGDASHEESLANAVRPGEVDLVAEGGQRNEEVQVPQGQVLGVVDLGLHWLDQVLFVLVEQAACVGIIRRITAATANTLIQACVQIGSAGGILPWLWRLVVAAGTSSCRCFLQILTRILRMQVLEFDAAAGVQARNASLQPIELVHLEVRDELHGEAAAGGQGEKGRDRVGLAIPEVAGGQEQRR